MPGRNTSDRVPFWGDLMKVRMNKLSVFLISSMLSATATADITELVVPTRPLGGYSGGAFTPSSAEGFYGAANGGFDNHWLLTVDAATPGLTFTVENGFNPGNGAGAVGFRLVTVTGPGVPGIDLTREPTVCDPQGFSCHQRLSSTFAASAGTYDLHIVGGGEFQWQYDMTATVVPEPGTAALAGAGLLMLMVRMSRRRVGNKPPNGW